MTLCAIWREQEKIKFAADTRISFSNQYFDGAYKISPIRMEVDLVNPMSLSDEEYFYGNIGLCFAGSSFNTFVLKDTLIHALRGIVILDYRKIPPFSSYIEDAFDLYKKLSKQLFVTLSGQGQAQIALAGYCFKKERFESYLFEPEQVSNNADYSCNEIVSNEGDFIFLGSEKQLALKIYNDNYNNGFDSQTAKSIICQIIQSKSHPTVGGKIQIGSFDKNKSFSTYPGNTC